MRVGTLLAVEALGDSYYPDLGQTVSVERMVQVIEADPCIANAPATLEALRQAQAWLCELCPPGDFETDPGEHTDRCHALMDAIDIAEGR